MKWSPQLPQHPSVTTHNHYSNRGTFLSNSRAKVSGQALCHTWACVCHLHKDRGTKLPISQLSALRSGRKRGAERREGRTLESLRLTWEMSIKAEEKGTKWNVPRLAHADESLKKQAGHSVGPFLRSFQYLYFILLFSNWKHSSKELEHLLSSQKRQ